MSNVRLTGLEFENEWIRGFCAALADVHGISRDSSTIVEAARNAGLTIPDMKRAGVLESDWKELQKAGVRTSRRRAKAQ